MPRSLTLAACILCCALPVFGVAASTAPKEEAEVSAKINGSVVDDAGNPIEGATVFVYSAHLKKGYAAVCPTCWIDCGKRAETNARGQFTITDLNPALKFRLLVLKEGFTPTAKGGVDPAQGPMGAIAIKARAPAQDESQVLYGRLTDIHGSPVAGALVEPVAAALSEGGTMFGTIPWIDPLAATDSAGRFNLIATKPVQSITLKVSPRALAAKFVTAQQGPAANAVVLTEGATVMGRLVDPQGKPVADAELVMVSHNRVDGLTFDDLRVGTEKDGSFAFTNVTTPSIWGIYPSQDSLRDRQLTAGQHLVEARFDRQVVKVGDIMLRPGFIIRGKVVLPDAEAIPPGMHVTINPEWASYNRLTDIAPDGSFEFTAVAPDVYSLDAGITGYTRAADTTTSILVEGNRSDVVIRVVRAP